MATPVHIGAATLYHADCLDAMRKIERDTIDIIVTDPPYFKVKNEAWDRAWDDADEFLTWIGLLCEEWQRILRGNGSLYCFASTRISARIEMEIARRFYVLNNIRWLKNEGWHKGADKDCLRAFFPQTEAIIFAEHYGADNIATGVNGYKAKCDELRGFIFEPLRAYLAGEMERSGHSKATVNRAWREWKCNNGGMASHWFSSSQWELPTQENYSWLRALFNAKCNGSGMQYLRREYEDLRREYEDLRRPFAITTDIPYTDIWSFPTVTHYTGKHPCEKPIALIEHMLRVSSREGAVVLDPLMGTGTTGVAALRLGRSFIGIEREEEYFNRACERIAYAIEAPEQMEIQQCQQQTRKS